jgi:hypothetical protein
MISWLHEILFRNAYLLIRQTDQCIQALISSTRLKSQLSNILIDCSFDSSAAVIVVIRHILVFRHRVKLLPYLNIVSIDTRQSALNIK